MRDRSRSGLDAAQLELVDDEEFDTTTDVAAEPTLLIEAAIDWESEQRWTKRHHEPVHM